MVRKAIDTDLDALIRFRCAVFGGTREAAEGWLTRVAGLDNVMLLTHESKIISMLCAVPVTLRGRKGVLFCGMATQPEWRGRGLMTKLLAGCLKAYAACGCTFAVTVPRGRRAAENLAKLGFSGAFPLRMVERPIQHNLWAQADFDNMTVKRLSEARLQYQPGSVCLPEESMAETIRQLYAQGITLVANARAYGLYYVHGDTLQFIELQAENDHSADVLLEAAREKTGASRAMVLLAEMQPLYLGEGKRRGYGMLKFLAEPFPVKDGYFRLLLGE